MKIREDKLPEFWNSADPRIWEAVYQTFKERLMRELVRDGLVVGDKKWKLVVESADRAGG